MDGRGGRRVWQVSKPLTLTLTLTLTQAKLNGKPVTFTDKRAARDATTYCYINATKIADIMIKFFEQTPDAASLAQDVAGQLTNVLAKYIKDIKSVFRYYRSVHTSCSCAGVGSSHRAHSERGVAHTPEQSRSGGQLYHYPRRVVETDQGLQAAWQVGSQHAGAGGHF